MKRITLLLLVIVSVSAMGCAHNRNAHKTPFGPGLNNMHYGIDPYPRTTFQYSIS